MTSLALEIPPPGWPLMNSGFHLHPPHALPLFRYTAALGHGTGVSSFCHTSWSLLPSLPSFFPAHSQHSNSFLLLICLSLPPALLSFCYLLNFQFISVSFSLHLYLSCFPPLSHLISPILFIPSLSSALLLVFLSLLSVCLLFSFPFSLPHFIFHL